MHVHLLAASTGDDWFVSYLFRVSKRFLLPNIGPEVELRERW